MLYPLTFEPAFKERVWGGRNLERLYRKPLPPGRTIGESWEISDRPGTVSVIANGPLAGRDLRWLMEHHAEEVLGAALPPERKFPLLVKILDAQEVLSLQVHPPALAAARLGGEPKTEVWYVVDAAEGAEIYLGLKRGMTREAVERALRAGTVAECLQREPVERGDAAFVPSGRIHALGAGTVIFEIQQNSDTTYRVFDWNRLGADGQPRDLHVAESLACMDFGDFAPGLVRSRFVPRGGVLVRNLVDTPLFSVEECRAEAGCEIPRSATNRPLIIGLISGRLSIRHPPSEECVRLGPGHFCLLPASLQEVSLTAEASLACLMAEPGEVIGERGLEPAIRYARR